MSCVFQICNDLNNVGDLLAPIITSRLFDVNVTKVFKKLPPTYDGATILSGLGSFLGYYGDWPLRVWGTGFEPGYMDRKAKAYQGNRELWKVYAVRGHITRTILKLGHDIVIGDPAILMPLIYEPQSAPYIKNRYFLHCENNIAPPIEQDIEIVSTRMNPFKAIDLICSTEFVFTEALHIAILAHSYKIPWAWSLNKHIRGIVKWFDWFSSIGVEPKCFLSTELNSAKLWYKKMNKEFRLLNVDGLLKSFPSEVIH